MLLALLLAALLPDFTGYVVDRAGLLDATAVAHVASVASRLDHAGIAQVAVCTVPASSLGDDSLRSTRSRSSEWGLVTGPSATTACSSSSSPGPSGTARSASRWATAWRGSCRTAGSAHPDRAGVPVHARPADYSRAAVHVVDALAAILQKDAAAGGDAAPGKELVRGGKGVGMPGVSGAANLGGLAVTVVCMGALAILLSASAARRRFPAAARNSPARA